MTVRGEFTPLCDDGVVKEIKQFISELEGIQSLIVSDHILNLLEEIEGRMPDDKRRILTLVDSYLSLPDKDRLVFRLGRREGILRCLEDLKEKKTYEKLLDVVDSYEGSEKGSLEKHLSGIMCNYV